MNAITASSWWITLAGARPATIAQNTQLMFPTPAAWR